MKKILETEIEKKCLEKGVKMTDHRKVVANVIEFANDHPDAKEIHTRALAYDNKIGIATIYRCLKLFSEIGAIQEHAFKDDRTRYEGSDNSHHHHLIDIDSGVVIEFENEELEKIKKAIAKKLGYELIDHRLELYGTKIKD